MNLTADAASPDSNAIRQVWAWKDEIHNEVAHLPLDEALRAIGEKAQAAAQEFDTFRAKLAAIPPADQR